MSESLYREHTARRDYRCGRECGSTIRAGSRYVVASLPPNSEMGNTGWWSMRLHGRDYNDCPTYHPEALEDPREIQARQARRRLAL